MRLGYILILCQTFRVCTSAFFQTLVGVISSHLFDVFTNRAGATAGHERKLTHCCTHPTQRLVLTSSEDTSFRMWDFRGPSIQAISVIKGHNE